MTDIEQETDKQQGIEYSIYTFDVPESGQNGQNKWEKRDIKTEISDAIATAKKLFKSGKYGKVEVKQKYFDKKKDRNIDVTLKIFEARSKREINIMIIFLFAILCGGLAFAVTYFLNR